MLHNMVLKQFSLITKKQRKHHHQILPYKRRIKIDTTTATATTWKITTKIVLIVLLLLPSCSHCSVIVNKGTNSKNELINSQQVYANSKDLVQSAKEIYLQSLRDILNSQLKNISGINVNIDKFTNINETEFTTKYQEYMRLVEYRRRQDELLLQRLNGGSGDGASEKAAVDAGYFESEYQHQRYGHRRAKRAINNNDLIYMHFDLPLNMLNDSMSTLDEAYLTIHLKRNQPMRKRRRRFIKVSVFQLTGNLDRVWLDTINLTVRSVGAHKKIRLNVQKAVTDWMRDANTNLGLQVFCENCHSHSIYVQHDAPPNDEDDHNFPYPTLQLALNGRQREKRHRSFRPKISDYTELKHQNHSKCSRKGDKCCRRQLKVQFKELAGYDFVIQPKVFDAGYCDGSCPTAYNPAHQHAVLQGRLADLGKYNVPRPCCTPSVLSDVDVLHVDEEDSTKLKVTTFKNMRVLQCACS